MNSGMPTQGGILFGPNMSKKMYLSSYKHRGSGSSEHKTIWKVSQPIEYGIFCDADEGDWKDSSGHYWGIHDQGITILGEGGERLCKFPCTANIKDCWHGFPVSPLKGEGNSPPDQLVQDWIEQKIINKKIGRDIQRRKI